MLARQDGPTIVAGHSYGGQIITALGTDAPNVVGLVYIAAFGLDEGSRSGSSSRRAPTPAPGAPARRCAGLRLDPRGLQKFFQADVDPVKANVMDAVQQPLAMSTIGDVDGGARMEDASSWFLVAEGDQAIPPDVERLFAQRMKATVEEIESSHVAMVSHPTPLPTSSSGGGASRTTEFPGIPRSG